MWLLCAECESHVVRLRDVKVITDGRKRCHLVAKQSNVDANFTRPHSEGADHPFKRGKVWCSICDTNLGNIQRFVDMRDQSEFCALKYFNIRFNAPGNAEHHFIRGWQLGPVVFGYQYWSNARAIRPVTEPHIHTLFPESDGSNSDADAGGTDVGDLNAQLSALGVA